MKGRMFMKCTSVMQMSTHLIAVTMSAQAFLRVIVTTHTLPLP